MKTMFHILAEIKVKTIMALTLINSEEKDWGEHNPQDLLLEIDELAIEAENILGLTVQYNLLAEVTGLLDEHPDGWEGPCLCTECIQAMQ